MRRSSISTSGLASGASFFFSKRKEGAVAGTRLPPVEEIGTYTRPHFPCT